MLEKPEVRGAGSRVPSREECVLRNTIETWCALKPDAPFLKVYQGPTLSYNDVRARVVEAAAGLASLGVRQGDTVVVWLPNGLDCLIVWFAINWLGAIYVPINVGYRGRLLQHVIGIANASVMVAHHDLTARLCDIDIASLKTLVVLDGPVKPLPGLDIRDRAALAGDERTLPVLERPIEPWDPQSIIFTSGTTGPSKGVLSSYAHMWAMSGRDAFPMLTGGDRYMCNLPLFHVGGTIALAAMLQRGGSLAIVPEFSTATFWDSICETQTTFVLLLGAMANFIYAQPENARDRDHTLRNTVIIPLLDTALAFGRRFGVDVYTFFNMSELSVPIVSGPNPAKTGMCGRARAGVDLRIVDQHDCIVPDGQPGELIIRTDAPWALNSGYYGNPAATAEAWRNGWFHTGDLFLKDADGDYLFVDRLKDSVRRRGENISSFEVEREILAHPAIREVAVVPVAADLSEDEILCVVAPEPGHVIDPEALLRFLEPRLAHFMLPRYIRIISDLPKTPTQKVEKYILRREGLTADTWDREQAGIRIRRQTISRTITS